MQSLKKIFLSILTVFCFYSIGNGQNLVQDFQVQANGDQIRLVVKATSEFQFEVLPFDSKTYTLLKLYPLQFPVETKEQWLAPLKSLPLQMQALELMDQSVMFTFKGILANQIKIKTIEHNRAIEIIIATSTANLHGNKERPNGQSAIDFYQTAVNLAAKKQYSDALSALHQVLQLKPDYAAALLLAGKIRFQRQEWSRAKINFTCAYRLEPNLVEAKSYLLKIDAILNPVVENDLIVLPTKPENITAEVDSNKKLTDAMTLISTMVSNSAISPTGTIIEPKPNLTTQPDQSAIKTRQTKVGSTNYFQMGLFLLIVLSVIVWFVILWRQRHLLKQARQNPAPDFAKMLQKMQNQTQTLGKDMPEFNTGVRTSESDKTSDKLAEKAADSTADPVWERDSIRKTLPRPSLPFIEPGYFSKMAKQTQRESSEEKILHYADMGFSIEEIARRTQLGRGEVQLILNLHGRMVPMSAPEVRIQME